MRDGLPQLKAVFRRAGCSDPGLRALAEPPLGVTGMAALPTRPAGSMRGLLQSGAGQGKGRPLGGWGTLLVRPEGGKGLDFLGRCSLREAPAPGARRSRHGRREREMDQVGRWLRSPMEGQAGRQAPWGCQSPARPSDRDTPHKGAQLASWEGEG